MIINPERTPTLSLYYLGGIILKILAETGSVQIDMLYVLINQESSENLHVDFLYYTLDWLFIANLVQLKGERISLCA